MDQLIETKRLDDRGLFGTGVEIVGQATEKTVRAAFGIVRDARTEMKQRALGLIDGVQGVQQGLVGLARSVVQRTDEVATAWIDADEEVVLGAVRALMTTGQSATRFAAKAAASVTGTRQDGAPVAQA